MSNKGIPQTIATRQKIALANQTDRAELHQRLAEYVKTIKPGDFPSITKAAIYSDISESALLHYESRTEENSEVRQILTKIRDRQKLDLMEKGLRKTYDSRLALMLLSVHHGMREQPQNLTQNNTFNISPELLAEAIELSRKK